MDVAAIEVGTDFVDQVEKAIADSDVSLVVIGPDWLRLEEALGGRRLDDPDDHVRSEVRSALASANPVVPVLVDGATLPSAEDLPEELTSLARRQAVELHDETWAQDVEMLMRRLEGRDPVRSPRRVRAIAVGLVALVVAGVAVWRALAGGGGGDLTGCEIPDDNWTTVDVSADATAVQSLQADGALRYTVVGANFQAESSEWLVVLDVRLHNESEDVANGNDDHTGYGSSMFDALRVNQVSVGGPYCFDVISGDDDLSPDEGAIVRVGFESPLDPTGVSLMLETDGPLLIEITTSA